MRVIARNVNKHEITSINWIGLLQHRCLKTCWGKLGFEYWNILDKEMT